MDRGSVGNLISNSELKPINIKITAIMLEVIDKKAKREGVSRSEIILNTGNLNKLTSFLLPENAEIKSEIKIMLKEDISTNIKDDSIPYIRGIYVRRLLELLSSDINKRESDFSDFLKEVLDNTLKNVSIPEKRRILNLLMMDKEGVKNIIQEIIAEEEVEEKIQKGIQEDMDMLKKIMGDKKNE